MHLSSTFLRWLSLITLVKDFQWWGSRAGVSTHDNASTATTFFSYILSSSWCWSPNADMTLIRFLHHSPFCRRGLDTRGRLGGFQVFIGVRRLQLHLKQHHSTVSYFACEGKLLVETTSHKSLSTNTAAYLMTKGTNTHDFVDQCTFLSI